MIMMNHIFNLLFWVSQSALLLSKAPDLWTTYRYVGASGETNPIGSWLFRRFGLLPGLIIAGVIHLIVVSVGTWWAYQNLVGVWLLMWSLSSLWVAWVHLEVARINAGGRHGRMTRWIQRTYFAWGRHLGR